MSRPRVGFLGVGWIGRNRLQAIADTNLVDVVAVSDPSPEAAQAALTIAPGAALADDLDGLLAFGLDGVVIATPSALHAEQTIRALEAGCAVFCQKPLGRTEREVRAVVAAARAADRLLAVDLSYRFTKAMVRIRERMQAGDLGRVFAVDLVFHNAYGPDKAWFRDPALSGGGCVMDLGVHLVDLALWALDFPEVTQVASHLYAGGEPLGRDRGQVEDFAVATLTLATGAVVRLACSWNLPAGCDAVIEASFHGEKAGASLRNVDGSFFDFTGEITRGSDHREIVASPPDDWDGRAAAAWSHDLASGGRFISDADRLVNTASVLDAIYRNAAGA